MNPLGRSLVALRRAGWTPDITERWLPHAGVRRDFLGFADLVAVKPGEPVLAVQATTASNLAARLAKARALPTLRTWIAAGCRFEVHGWAKVGDRWHVRRVSVTGQDLDGLELQPLPRRRRLRKGERQGLLFVE